ncbi:uncharacterized protein F5147DRAFT_757584 [Suillus discolor]|uniref:Uncharacterized protein n=1 Tax=Suillus discolor TaxID=1912936 RepID=A0A9P7FJ37_9AGAM|nr:uncharacterized protein F5147DRAFT_757584 [Suillus discolor]KAG2117882.1 hypothetical protein F5147DRAFT_757584 [Suillus discolor]
MSSIIFNPAMLTVSPSPSPKPEERPLEGGNVSIDDTTLDDAAPKEPEESESDWVERAWAAMLNTMRMCVETAPPSKPELLEEQESWLHDWNVAMADMTVVYEWARAASLHVSLNDTENVTLAEGKIAARTLTRAMKAWKEKAEESAMTACPACAEKGKGKEVIASEKIVEKATEKSAVLLRGASIVPRPALIAAKNKGRAPAVPKCKAPPSTQTTAPDTGKSEVEIVGEATANEPIAGTSKETIVVQRPKQPLASAAEPVVKRPRLDANTELDEACAESAQLRAENAELHTRNDKYQVALTEMCQHSWTQESELLHMSNWLYLLARDWGTWEKELCEVLEE